ncbi:hypothetical protein CRG98_049203 [Punica granatum]|uniref:Uncharacterized protein n=1 Tax=Punica granatum TaxID=22663 RepID=A0A2I0HGC4_PUNGR|nr:hypothetical protein CRG98_049203 [Punica granatum]
MHVRGARRTGRAARAHGRHAGSVRRASRRAGRTGVLGQQARAVAGVLRLCGYGCTIRPRARPSPEIT